MILLLFDCVCVCCAFDAPLKQEEEQQYAAVSVLCIASAHHSAPAGVCIADWGRLFLVKGLHFISGTC
jgi:hypothetical protein